MQRIVERDDGMWTSINNDASEGAMVRRKSAALIKLSILRAEHSRGKRHKMRAGAKGSPEFEDFVGLCVAEVKCKKGFGAKGKNCKNATIS
jgi:hypothetical protein